MTIENNSEMQPPGHPGLSPRWTSSAKYGVGTTVNPRSQVWFTLSHGIVNEVYYPNIDQANIRDLGFIVTDGKNFFSEEKRDGSYKTQLVAPGVPAYRLTNTCNQGRYRITKTVIVDPLRDVLLQRVEFEPMKGQLNDYNLYALLAPHLNNQGYENSGWVGDYKGNKMLYAQREGTTLALACSTPFEAMSCGYVGTSDGWQDLHIHNRLTNFYQSASDGNIALTGQINLAECGGKFVLALAFGNTPDEAGQRARAALLQDFETTLNSYVEEWQTYQAGCFDPGTELDEKEKKLKTVKGKKKLGKVGKVEEETSNDLYRVSTMVLKVHEAKRFPGAMIASLSIPWGNFKGDQNLGGYHLVWPRDMIESAGALLAAGQKDSARRAIFYLMSTQEADGHWLQNMWADGRAYWQGIQMDETALFILLADTLRRNKAFGDRVVWSAVLKAAGFVARNGPVTGEGRWEENPGYSPFTLATEIAALLAAADFAEDLGQSLQAEYFRQTADIWNAHIERWIYVKNTELARQVGVEGYYIRLAAPESWTTDVRDKGTIRIANLPAGQSEFPAAQIVSPDALALVRFGLRAPDSPAILDTIKVIDAVLKSETPTGPVWHRYSPDGYGEHTDGSPFDGTGIGRGWPLLAGERAHYELAAGNVAEAIRLQNVMSAQTGPGGLLPEQIWDSEDITELNLLKGHPSHSARPLVWAHAEYVKLVRSLKNSQIFDMPPQTLKRYRYAQKAFTTPYAIWRFNHKTRTMPAGKILRVEVLASAEINFSFDNWDQMKIQKTQDSELGIYYADLPTQNLPSESIVSFTFCWLQNGNWEGQNFEVVVKME